MENKIKLNNKFIIIGISILLILLVGTTGTYAWLTWSSKPSPVLTMTIGELVDVTFNNGPELKTSLAPVFSYYDGESMNISIKHKGISKDIIGHSIRLNITNIPNELKDKSFKYRLVSNNGEFVEGDFSTADSGTSITLVDGKSIISDLTNYTFYLYIDSNMENNSNMVEKNFIGNIEISAYELQNTSLTNFTYILGTDKTTIDKINYFNKETKQYEEVSINPITIEENDILLVDYKGALEEVNIPNVYTENDKTYNTVILSEVYIDEDNKYGIFKNNNIIKRVNIGDEVEFISIDNKEVKINSSKGLFEGCTKLERISHIPSTINSMENMFNGCTCLTGTIRIESSNIDEIKDITSHPFYDTSKNIILETIKDSNTYNNLNNYLPDNVTLITY